MKNLLLLIICAMLCSCATQQHFSPGDQVQMKHVLLHKSNVYTVVAGYGNSYDVMRDGKIYRDVRGLKKAKP